MYHLTSKPRFLPSRLSACAPDVLQESIPLSQTVQAVITLAHSSYESGESIDLVFTGVSAVLINLSDADLDGSVVLGLNDTVGGTALAWDVAISYRFSLATAETIRSTLLDDR